MKELRIIIAGSRDYNDYKYLKISMKNILERTSLEEVNKIKIISGTANGADQLGERFAKQFKLEVIKFPAKWDLYGKHAGYIRNEEMAKYSMEDNNYGMLVAFWDGESRGTKHMINLANKHGLEVHVIKYKETNNKTIATVKPINVFFIFFIIGS